MKNYLFLFLVFWSTFSFGQDTTTAKVDTTNISIGSTKIIIISEKDGDDDESEEMDSENQNESSEHKHKNRKSIWSGIQVGTNTLTANQEISAGLQLDQSRNRNFSLNLFSRRFNLGSPYAAISTGLGLEFNRYAFEKNVTLNYNDKNVWMTSDTVNQYYKNYLKTTHLTMPLLLEFNTHKDASDGFRLALGVEAGYLLGAKTVQKYRTNGNKQKDKSRGSFNIRPFRLSPIAIVGYKKVSLFAKVDMNDFFEKDKGPVKNQASFGLLFSFN